MISWVSKRFGAKSVLPVTASTSEALLRIIANDGNVAGVLVSQDTATRLATVYSCIKVRGEAFAQMTPKVYTKQADGSRVEDPGHWLSRLLGGCPCADMDSFAYLERVSNDLDKNGNHFAFKKRKGNEVVELIPFCPKDVTVAFDAPTRRRRYTIDGFATPTKREFFRDDIFHVHLMSRDGLRGMSPIEECRNTIGLMGAAERHGLKTFENGALVASILKYPEKLDDDQYKRLQDDLDQNWKGDKAWRTMLLESGASYESIGINNRDSQFLETRQFSRSEICGIYQVPPHRVGDLSRSTNNNIEQQALELVTAGVTPAVNRYESVWNSTELMGTGSYLECNIDVLIRGDFKTRTEGYKTLISMGVMTPNEARAKENMPALPDGNQLMMMANITSLEKAVQGVTALASTQAGTTDGEDPAEAVGDPVSHDENTPPAEEQV